MVCPLVPGKSVEAVRLMMKRMQLLSPPPPPFPASVFDSTQPALVLQYATWTRIQADRSIPPEAEIDFENALKSGVPDLVSVLTDESEGS